MATQPAAAPVLLRSLLVLLPALRLAGALGGRAAPPPLRPPAASLTADVVVYGSTPAGVMAAVAAAREGASVLLLDPRATPVGGMMSGGLANTDIGTTTAVLGGLTRAFFEANCAHYYPSKAPCAFFNFEPHVAEQIFLGPSFLGNASLPITVSLASRLTSIRKVGATIISGVTLAGDLIDGRYWIDATYDGALLAIAGVSSAFGRESNETYGESVAGVLPEPHYNATPAEPFTSQGQLWTGLSPFWPNGSTIPLVTPPPGPVGSGDDRLQAWNVRITLTNDTANMVQPWPRPASYDPASFELLRRYVAMRNATVFEHTGLCCGGTLPAPPGAPFRSKFDVNSQRLDFQGLNWGYAQAVQTNDFAAQERILQAHRDFTLGAYYFLQNDPALPASMRASMSDFGLPLDEHVACGHLPCQVYVREALRMVSDFVLTQADVETAVNKSDSVGMGAYSIDVMHGSTYADAAAGILQEGGMQAPSFLPKNLVPFQVPLRALLPRRAEATNLLVPVALSASHVAFCAVRLEPTWTVLGESAGVAAALAARTGCDVQDIDVAALQARQRAVGQVLEL